MTATESILIASWNIGGGHVFEGESHGDRAGEDLDYFVSTLAAERPDIVCLQEAHSFGDRTPQAAYIAESLGYPHVQNFPMSESHIELGAKLSLAIMSDFPLEDPSYQPLRTPQLTSVQPNGDTWRLFEKAGCQATAKTPLGDVQVVNVHQHPFHYFGVTAFDSEFEDIWSHISSLISEAGPSAVVCIDTNAAPVRDLLPTLTETHWISAEGNPTTPKGAQQDYFLLGSALSPDGEETIQPTRADHHLLKVRFSPRHA